MRQHIREMIEREERNSLNRSKEEEIEREERNNFK